MWMVLMDIRGPIKLRFFENWFMYWWRHTGKRMVASNICFWVASLRQCLFDWTQKISEDMSMQTKIAGVILLLCEGVREDVVSEMDPRLKEWIKSMIERKWLVLTSPQYIRQVIKNRREKSKIKAKKGRKHAIDQEKRSWPREKERKQDLDQENKKVFFIDYHLWSWTLNAQFAYCKALFILTKLWIDINIVNKVFSFFFFPSHDNISHCMHL